MRRSRSILAALALALLIPALLSIRGRLPAERHAMIEKKYDGWSGVLRLWAFQGWESGAGSLAPWLNRCIERFERTHAGVYVQPRWVDAGAIAALNDSGILPPDLLLFPPGLLETPEGLAPLEAPIEAELPRGALADAGRWDGALYALPVAMGGTLWAYDAASLSGIPADWTAQEASPACPADEPYRRWSAALLALCAGVSEGSSESAVALPDGLELGLSPAPAAPDPSPTALPDGAAGCALPPGFAPSEDAFRAFLNGDAAAVPVTQREIRRLEALSDRGRGPDWRLAAGGAAFSDQLAAVAVVDGAEGPRVALSRQFAAHLLSPDCQGELHRAGAFSVTDAASGYAAGDALLALERALRADGLCAPPVFGTAWTDGAAEIIRKFMAGEGDPPSLWRQMRALLSKNTNISGAQ